MIGSKPLNIDDPIILPFGASNIIDIIEPMKLKRYDICSLMARAQ